MSERSDVGMAPVSATERATPYYCPYCSDEDLRPDAADGAALPPGTWRCTGCSRMFALRYVGAGSPNTRTSEVS